MTSEQLIEALRRTDPDRGDEMDRLATAVRHQSRELVRALLKTWAGSDPVESRKAAILLGQCEEVAMGPLLDSRDAVGTAERVWRMRTTVEGELQLRERVRTRLEPLFDDRTPVPMPEPLGSSEEPPQPRRICDEAYLLLRRMLNPHEGALTYQLNSRAFLASTEKERDEEIARMRRSGAWSQFVEPIAE